MKAKERLLKYAVIKTPSDESSDSTPSSACQFDLANLLKKEMEELVVSNIQLTDNCFLYGKLPATKGYENAPAIGFIAHMDTVADYCEQPIRPIITDHYDGKELALSNSGLILSPEMFPHLESLKGHTLITTDGNTILGADDKAGIAEILTMVEHLQAESIPHGPICIAFTPDEEIGTGASHFDVELFGADFAYTLDGSTEGELEYENFNAASCAIKVHGVNIHPGSAKNQMRNALLMAIEWNSMLPPAETPAHTCGYEGFYHLMHMEGDEELATLQYIIRDHDAQKFDARKATVQQITDYLNQKWGAGTFECVIRDSYRTMREIMEQHMDVEEKAKAEFEENGVTTDDSPNRGGTDDERQNCMGQPRPENSNRGYNFHGRKEMITVEAMEAMVNVLESIVRNA